MKTFLLFLATLLVLSTSCTSSGKITIDDDYHYGNNESIDFVILHHDPNDRWLFLENVIPVELTETDLKNINRLLQEAVNDYNKVKDSWEKDIELSKYNRQYVATKNENGDKEVFVNCFRNERIRKNEYWKTGLVVVMDGGNYFFKLKINLTKSTYYDFFVNGHA